MAENKGLLWGQIKAAFRLGAGTKGQSCDGTFTAGNLPKYSVTANDGTLGDSGIAVSSLATKSGVQQEAYTYAADIGTANAYAGTLAPAPTIIAGSQVTIKVANTNTGASTLAVNGGTATAVKKESASGLVSLAAGDWQAGQIVTVIYDGTQWQWVGGGAGVGAGAGTGSWIEEIPTGALNSTNRVFTLGYTPIAGSLTLFLNIVQREGTDFTISASTITFTVAPKARDTGWFQARYQH